MSLMFQAVQILYWLTLSIWLGGMVFLAMAAPVVFRVVRRLEARSGKYAHEALRDEQTPIVAGEIVGMLLARLGQVQMVCAILLLPLLIAQLLLVNLDGTNFIAAVIRVGLWLVATAVVLYEWRSHYPKTWRLRQQFLASADNPEQANAAREAFDREHRRSEQLFLLTVCVLIGLVMLSANVTPRPHTVAPSAPATSLE